MVENINNLKNLLQNVSTIQKKYDDIALITGENFNIFSVLKMDSSEVRMHSGFIGELLNPKGSHGLKEVPLKIFIDLFKFKFIKTDIKEDETIVILDKFILDTESAITTVEKYIGFTNENKTEGGRIDIIIEDKYKNALIIENKIYAVEQANQLIRYNNYSKNAPILYLTLHGNAPTSHGELKENIDYFNISYKNDIKEWLKLCLKEAVEFPMLREVIKQYLYLIKKLTNQTINNKMSKEIINIILKSEENFDSLIQLDKMKIELREIIFKEKVFNTLEAVADKLDLELQINSEVFLKTNSSYVGFSFTNLKLSEMNIRIMFQFGGVFTDLDFGLNKITLDFVDDDRILPKKNKLIELFIKQFNAKLGGEWWYGMKSYDTYRNWNNLNTWKLLSFGDDFKQDLEEKLRIILHISNNLE